MDSLRRPSLSCSLLALTLVAACGPKAGGTEETGTEGTTGNELSPSATCDAYLECASVVTPEGLGPLLDAYGPDGTCWQSTPDVAAQCEVACDSGLAQLQMAFPDEPACAEQADDTAGDATGTGTGTGVEVTERTVDILFVVDNSGSMGEEQAYLAQGIEGLVRTLDNADPPVDFRVGVTTTDNGNPWCQGTSPEAGQLRATSCLSRPTEFVFEGAVTIDAFAEACEAQCSIPDLGLADPWIDVGNATGGGVTAEQAIEQLRCMLPQGINGCGFEGQLESMNKAIRRMETTGEASFGFRRDGSLLAVMILTDEADCSHDPTWDTIFLPDGNRVFWSDPEAPAPSSAVCWNAGVSCVGSGTYDDCMATNFDVDGLETTPDNAVLYPVERYTSQLADHGAFVMAINGVNSDGSVTYQDSLSDPQFQGDFGIGPGCSSTAGLAVPPVRVREVIETISGPGNQRSICDSDYSSSLSTFGSAILSRLPAQ